MISIFAAKASQEMHHHHEPRRTPSHGSNDKKDGDDEPPSTRDLPQSPSNANHGLADCAPLVLAHGPSLDEVRSQVNARHRKISVAVSQTECIVVEEKRGFRERVTQALFDFVGYGEEVEPPFTGAIVWFSPSSPFLIFWEFFSALLILYSTIITPFLISFWTEEMGHCGYAPTIKFDIAVDLFFMLEIFIHFLCGMHERGKYIFLLRETCAKRIKTPELWLDVASAIPISFVEFFAVPNIECDQMSSHTNIQDIRMMRLLRMLRLLRLLKVLKIFDILRKLFRLRPNFVRLLKATFSVCMIAHVGGCAWWFIQVQQGLDSLEYFKEKHKIGDGLMDSYLSSFYFIMATLCTVGYGDISAITPAEQAFAVVVMLLGATVFAIIVSNTSALVAGMTSQENRLIEEMDEALEVVSDLRDRSELEAEIRLFYAHRAHTSHRHHNGGLWESTEAIAQLPVKLRRKIVVSLSREMLGKVPLFENSDLDQDFVEELIFTMESVTFSPKEFLFFQGDVGDCMYIIVDGQIDVYVTKDEEEGSHLLTTMSKGDVIGERAVIKNMFRSATAIARGFVDVHRLSKRHFDEVCNRGYMAEREKLEKMLSEMERDFKNKDGPAQWVPKQRSQDDISAPRLNREGSDKMSVKSGGNASLRSLSVRRRSLVKGDMPKQTYSDVESAGQSFASENLPYNPYSFEAGSYATKRRGSGGGGAWPERSAGHPFSSESTRANRAHRGSRVHARYGTDASKRHSNASYNESARQSAYSTLLDRNASTSHDPSLDFNVGQGNLSRVPSDGSIETRETAKFQVGRALGDLEELLDDLSMMLKGSMDASSDAHAHDKDEVAHLDNVVPTAAMASPPGARRPSEQGIPAYSVASKIAENLRVVMSQAQKSSYILGQASSKVAAAQSVVFSAKHALGVLSGGREDFRTISPLHGKVSDSNRGGAAHGAVNGVPSSGLTRTLPDHDGSNVYGGKKAYDPLALSVDTVGLGRKKKPDTLSNSRLKISSSLDQ